MRHTTLKGKIAVITGASSGIGESCAHYLARQGVKLILCARRLERLQQIAKELESQYQAECTVFELDIRDRLAITQQLTALPAPWQEIDILINNAGLSSGLDKIQEASIEDWELMIDTNVKGLLYITRQILPGMIERQRGHIINIGSISGHQLYPGGNVYCATKFAVHAINQGLRMDLLGQRIRVSTIDPGLVETEFSAVRFKGDASRANAVYQNFHPLSPDDVADAVVYCLSAPEHVNITELHIHPLNQATTTMVLRE